MKILYFSLLMSLGINNNLFSQNDTLSETLPHSNWKKIEINRFFGVKYLNDSIEARGKGFKMERFNAYKLYSVAKRNELMLKLDSNSIIYPIIYIENDSIVDLKFKHNDTLVDIISRTDRANPFKRTGILILVSHFHINIDIYTGQLINGNKDGLFLLYSNYNGNCLTYENYENGCLIDSREIIDPIRCNKIDIWQYNTH